MATKSPRVVHHNPRHERSKSPARGSLGHFRAFLAAADRVAVQLLLDNGLILTPGRDDFSGTVLPPLAETFVGEYARTDIDDVCTIEELDAKIEAAYMVGLAVGLRLDAGLAAGLGLQRAKGGAR